MALRRGSLLFVVYALVLQLAGGCAPATTVATNKAADYTGHPKMLFVAMVFDPAHGINVLFQSFQARLEAGLQDCGVTTHFFAVLPTGRDPLQLDTSADPQVAALQAEITRFRPDTFMTVQVTTYRVQVESVTQFDYFFQLSEAASRKPVWKARGTLTRRLSTLSEAGSGLAQDIVTRLLQDGVLAACKVAAGMPAVDGVVIRRRSG
jgi:hypothetical protein